MGKRILAGLAVNALRAWHQVRVDPLRNTILNVNLEVPGKITDLCSFSSSLIASSVALSLAFATASFLFTGRSAISLSCCACSRLWRLCFHLFSFSAMIFSTSTSSLPHQLWQLHEVSQNCLEMISSYVTTSLQTICRLLCSFFVSIT